MRRWRAEAQARSRTKAARVHVILGVDQATAGECEAEATGSATWLGDVEGRAMCGDISQHPWLAVAACHLLHLPLHLSCSPEVNGPHGIKLNPGACAGHWAELKLRAYRSLEPSGSAQMENQ